MQSQFCKMKKDKFRKIKLIFSNVKIKFSYSQLQITKYLYIDKFRWLQNIPNSVQIRYQLTERRHIME